MSCRGQTSEVRHLGELTSNEDVLSPAGMLAALVVVGDEFVVGVVVLFELPHPTNVNVASSDIPLQHSVL